MKSKKIENKRTLYGYSILQQYRAGIVLEGTEVKSLRSGLGSFAGSYCVVRDGEAYLVNAHIPAYRHARHSDNYDTRKTRKLLLHQKEINELKAYDKAKGFAILPISLYTEVACLKLDIGVCKHKKLHDKRQSLRKRTETRKMRRVLKTYNKN